MVSMTSAQAYLFLGAASTNPGDRIYLFGFSGGAYTVRVLRVDPQGRLDIAGSRPIWPSGLTATSSFPRTASKARASEGKGFA